MDTGYVPNTPFEEYKELLKDYFILERDEQGILVVRMHTKGGECLWSMELHRAFGQLFRFVGADRDNELMILTGTGDYWLRDVDAESFRELEETTEMFHRESYFAWYQDGLKMMEALLWDVEIPTIGLINGPGHHTEVAMLCDMTLCAEDAKILEAHYAVGMAPGDALFLVLQQLIGIKRANYAMYQAKNINADKALEWGLVNEVLPKDQLLTRAHELAAVVLQQDPIVRRITTQIVKRPWHKAMTEDFRMHFGHQMWGVMVHTQDHGEMDIPTLLDRD